MSHYVIYNSRRNLKRKPPDRKIDNYLHMIAFEKAREKKKKKGCQLRESHEICEVENQVTEF